MTTTTIPTRQPLAIFATEPERLFRVERVRETDTVVSSSMPTGGWLERGEGRYSGGVLGVLVDDVLGYAVMVERPADHWSVSSEISIDFCGPIEPGTHLSARAQPVWADARGAVTSGQVVDADGRLVAVGRQHGRFVNQLPEPVTNAGPGPDPRDAGWTDPASIFDLLGARPRVTDGGAVLDVAATTALLNPLGNVHGGITLCLADLTAMTAIEGTGRPFDTASIHVAYVRPIPHGTCVTFTALIEHAGRSFAVARVEARNPEGKLCASATVTAGSR